MIKVAVGLIFGDNGQKILLCQRRPGLPYPHKWEFPGGKVNDGETTEECLKRELSEELNINPLQYKFYHREKFRYTSGEFDVHYFTVQSYEGEPSNHLFADMRWVPMTELNNYDHLDGNYSTVKKLMNEYENTGSF
jgi:8-oxo-dGTP diphosphatase